MLIIPVNKVPTGSAPMVCAAIQAKLDRVVAQVDDLGFGTRLIKGFDRDRLVGDTVITVGTIITSILLVIVITSVARECKPALSIRC